MTIKGGTVTANATNGVAIYGGENITITGGTVIATVSKDTTSSGASGIDGYRAVEISGGNVTATGAQTDDSYGIEGSGITISGTNPVTVTAQGYYWAICPADGYTLSITDVLGVLGGDDAASADVITSGYSSYKYIFTTSIPETKSLVVDTTIDRQCNFDGIISLRDAIKYAEEGTKSTVEAYKDTATITFADSIFDAQNKATITLKKANGALTVNADKFASTAPLFIVAETGKTLTLDGGYIDAAHVSTDGTQILNIGTGNTVSLTNLTFTNGYAANGGAIYNEGTLTITDCTFTGNKADSKANNESNGGAIYNKGKIEITNAVFENNIAFAHTNTTENGLGGAIYNGTAITETETSMTITGTTFGDGTVANQNSAAVGGAIYNKTGTIVIKGGEFNLNIATGTGSSADKVGGAIYTCDMMTIMQDGTTGTTFANNTADNGGAIYINPGTKPKAGTPTLVTIIGAIFDSNKATKMGGAIYTQNNPWQTNNPYNVLIQGCSFLNNSVTTANGEGGGAIYNGPKVTMTIKDNGSTKTLFTGNTAANAQQGGGAILNRYILSVEGNTTFGDATEAAKGNSAKNGGAIYNYTANTDATLTIKDNVVFHNNSAGSGGAIYNNAGSVTINNAVFSDNKATGAVTAISLGGGAINSYATAKGSLTVTGGSFTNNITEQGDGGAICIFNGTDNSISNVTFTGNKAEKGYGGAINYAVAGLPVGKDVFDSKLSVAGCTFTGNSAGNGGAIATSAADWKSGETIIVTADATLNITGTTTFTGNSASSNGGAIFNGPGHLSDVFPVEDSTVKVNITGAVFGGENETTDCNYATDSGGAIYNEGVVTITGGSFKNNFAMGNGNNDGGGAIYNKSSVEETATVKSLTITNATFIGNAAGDGNGGAIYNKQGTLVINGGSFSYNKATDGGAIYNTAKVTIQKDGDNGTTFTGNTATGNGGAIFSGAMLSASPLLGPSVTSEVTITGATFNGTALTGSFSDNETITREYTTLTYKNAGSEGEGWYYDNGTKATDVTGYIYTKDGVSYVAAADAGEGTDASKFFAGNIAQNGGAIYNSAGTVTVNGGSFSNNAATNGGGAIYNEGESSSLTITGAVFGGANAADGNTAWYGGAIYNKQGTLSIKGGSFSHNATKSCGGAIFNEKGTLTIQKDDATGTTFTANSANGDGGAIYNTGKLEVHDATFSNHKLTGNAWGGAIYSDSYDENNDGYLKIYDSVFKGNQAAEGGAVYNKSDDYHWTTSVIERSTFGGTGEGEGNKATPNAYENSNGGAISVTYGAMNVTDCIFINNEAEQWLGGAIAAFDCALTISVGKFTGNTAKESGGAISLSSGTLTIKDSTVFKNNQSLGDGDEMGGGAIFCEGSMTVNGAIFGGTGTGDGNTAAMHGGAIFISTGYSNIEITNATFIGNEATEGGGGAINYVVMAGEGPETNAFLTVTDSTFIDNNAVSGGAISTVVASISGEEEGISYSFIANAKVTVANSTFTGNQATGDGTSIAAGGFGGAIYNGAGILASMGESIVGTGSTMTVLNSTFTNNSAAADTTGDNPKYFGQAIYNADKGVVKLANNIIVGNGMLYNAPTEEYERGSEMYVGVVNAGTDSMIYGYGVNVVDQKTDELEFITTEGYGTNKVAAVKDVFVDYDDETGKATLPDGSNKFRIIIGDLTEGVYTWRGTDIPVYAYLN